MKIVIMTNLKRKNQKIKRKISIKRNQKILNQSQKAK